jgi:sarcosine oxidase subunit gamma
MADTLQAASSLPIDVASRFGAELSIRVCQPAAILHLEGRRLGVGVADATLPAAGRCISDDAGLLLSIGPDVWFRVGTVDDTAAWTARFEAVVDVSSGWSCLALEGPKAVALLRKGCAVDLHERMFPPGSCCATGMARMRVVLWRPGIESRYEMLVGRSYALSLWSWLIDAAAEYCPQQTKEGIP